MCIKNLINLFFHAYENINWILSKKKKTERKKIFEKRQVKGIKIFLKNKKSRSGKMLVKGIKVFLKKKKISVNIIVNIIKIFQKIENKGSLSIEEITI